MKKIGEILLDKGFITEAQLEEALDIQRSQNHSMMLGMILIQLGYIDKKILNECLFLQLQDLVQDMTEISEEIEKFTHEIVD